ncbi:MULTISPECIES: ABC transporter ATP-binding protein [Enorma]|uniref:Bacitracin ABC transporter ATP-binding protein n=1 Tax=[Collinsella] massiliensis TaxID=1232426 RepID=A0A1Y3XTL0_9ACTN|nr:MULTISPECIES: ATP-binding cassette domain-containing protein [Enorma]OUN88812.1 bacitracin ABC transporter ATP-binding protein [[Collinsella] massiliensis]
MSATHNAVLSMEGVCLSFGAKRVLDGLTFSVERGTCFGFLGPSGAGKTTTIKLLTRQLTADAGRIGLFGRPIEHASGADYDRIGILSDTSSLYERLSIEENLRLYAHIRGRGARDIDRLLERMGLDRDRRTLIKNCSKGMRQRAALLAALIHSPELVFLDEPTSGLDPAARAEVHRMLAELKRGGTTIFITTHDMTEAETLCDQLAILDAGRIIALDAPASLTMRFARNRIVVTTRTQGVLELTKDAKAANTVRDLLAAGEVITMHSDEPDLEEVFLELTGREF